jgi:hypothetical protein
VLYSLPSLTYIPIIAATQVAASYVGENGELQRSLLTSMLAAGELSLAGQQQQLFGLQGEFEIHPERLAEEQARRRQLFLQMTLPADRRHYVECSTGLAAMGASLQQLLEQPAHSSAASEPSPASGMSAGLGSGEAPPAATSCAPGDGNLELLPVLGFYLEWQPDGESGSSPPSVLQISTGAVACRYFLMLWMIRQSLPCLGLVSSATKG